VLDIYGTWQLARLYFSKCPLICHISEAEVRFVPSPSHSDDAREYSSFNDPNERLYFCGTREGRAIVAHKRKALIQKAHTGALSPHTWGTAFWIRRANETS
jgi:hypothetical protein